MRRSTRRRKSGRISLSTGTTTQRNADYVGLLEHDSSVIKGSAAAATHMVDVVSSSGRSRTVEAMMIPSRISVAASLRGFVKTDDVSRMSRDSDCYLLADSSLSAENWTGGSRRRRGERESPRSLDNLS